MEGADVEFRAQCFFRPCAHREDRELARIIAQRLTRLADIAIDLGLDPVIGEARAHGRRNDRRPAPDRRGAHAGAVKKSLSYYDPAKFPALYGDAGRWTSRTLWNAQDAGDIGRAYNYPHVAIGHWVLYRVARNHPGLVTRHDWRWYLDHTCQTVVAMMRDPGDVAETGRTVTITPRDGARARLFVAPAGQWITLDAGKIASAHYAPATGRITLTLDPALPSTPVARLYIAGTTQTARSYAPLGNASPERGDFTVPLGAAATEITLAPR